jgi:hypothetical protein
MGPEHFSQISSAVAEIGWEVIVPVFGSFPSEGLEEVMEPQETEPITVAVGDG